MGRVGPHADAVGDVDLDPGVHPVHEWRRDVRDDAAADPRRKPRGRGRGASRPAAGDAEPAPDRGQGRGRRESSPAVHDGRHYALTLGHRDRRAGHVPRAPGATAPPAGSPHARPASTGGELLFVLGTALASLVALVPVLQLWQMRLDVPFAYGADATFNLMLVREPARRRLGQHELEPRRAVRAGALRLPARRQTTSTCSSSKLLAIVTRDPAVAMNLFYLLTFPAVAVAAVIVLRRLGLSRPASFARRRAVRIRPVPLLARRDAPVPLLVRRGADRGVPHAADDRGRAPVRAARPRVGSAGSRGGRWGRSRCASSSPRPASTTRSSPAYCSRSRPS